MARTKESKRKADVIQEDLVEEKGMKAKKTSRNSTPKGKTVDDGTDAGLADGDLTVNFSPNLTSAQKLRFFFNRVVDSPNSPFYPTNERVNCMILIHEQQEECYPMFFYFDPNQKHGKFYENITCRNGIITRGREFLPAYLGAMTYLDDDGKHKFLNIRLPCQTDGQVCEQSEELKLKPEEARHVLYTTMVAACSTDRPELEIDPADRAVLEYLFGIDFVTYGDLRNALGGVIQEIDREYLFELGPCLTFSFNGFD
jgi:hypothetical protein